MCGVYTGVVIFFVMIGACTHRKRRDPCATRVLRKKPTDRTALPLATGLTIPANV